nr:MAG TPA: hypothetical protein [Caudoviricetes sp.]
MRWDTQNSFVTVQSVNGVSSFLIIQLFNKRDTQ